ncbi:MAG: phosphoribosylformylglycinamidine synthase subunit PurS [Armatimonadetes bacterium]|nr:phosphoribosylformylglycinamidine synthase subunit PurS [Armatimonadota bacterium]
MTTANATAARVRLTILLKDGVLDAQGQAVERALRTMDYDAAHVRVGRVIDLDLPAANWQEAAREMCTRFLANPLIEEFEITRLDEEAR